MAKMHISRAPLLSLRARDLGTLHVWALGDVLGIGGGLGGLVSQEALANMTIGVARWVGQHGHARGLAPCTLAIGVHVTLELGPSR